MRWSGPRKLAGGAPQARGEILRLRRAGTVSRGPLNADVRWHLNHALIFEDLASALQELGGLLRQHNEDFWAKKVDADLRLIQQFEVYGVERFLMHFGGMGSLNDVVLTREGGIDLDPTTRQSANSRLRMLLTRAYQAAKQILRNAT